MSNRRRSDAWFTAVGMVVVDVFHNLIADDDKVENLTDKERRNLRQVVGMAIENFFADDSEKQEEGVQ